MKIRALIVDDEQLARDEMQYLLKDLEYLDVAGEASGGEEAVRMALELKPDLIFLDIQMPVMDGFQVVEILAGKNALPHVIFTTAYDQYAIRAFEIHAIDYLLKPIGKERLAESLDRVVALLPRRDEFIERIRKLTGNIKAGMRFLPRIVLRVKGSMELMEIDKIAMLSNERGRIVAWTTDGKFDSNYAGVDEIEVQVDPGIFIRLGADHLVNIKRIKQILPWAGGNYMMTLDDSAGTEVRLNRSQAQLLKNKVEGVF